MNDKLAYEKNKRRIFMSKYEQAIKLLEMLSSDEFQQFTSSEFDDAIYTAIEALELCEWRNCESDCKTCRSRCRAWQNGYNAKQEKMLTIIKR